MRTYIPTYSNLSWSRRKYNCIQSVFRSSRSLFYIACVRTCIHVHRPWLNSDALTMVPGCALQWNQCKRKTSDDGPRPANNVLGRRQIVICSAQGPTSISHVYADFSGLGLPGLVKNYSLPNQVSSIKQLWHFGIHSVELYYGDIHGYVHHMSWACTQSY